MRTVISTNSALMLVTEPSINMYGGKKPKYNECLIRNKRMFYDGCSTDTLRDAKEFYAAADGWEYIGSSRIVWYNGESSTCLDITHFFILKTKSN